MKLGLLMALTMAAAVSAQVGSIGVKAPEAGPIAPRTAGEPRISAAGPPLLGYVAGPEATELHAIVGRFTNPQLGDQIAIPDNAKAVYLSPAQNYALVGTKSAEPLFLWRLHSTSVATTQIPTAITGSMSDPDLVSFSPRGLAAVLYSQSNGALQIISGLPTQPIVKKLALSSVGIAAKIAVSDDAAEVVVALADSRLMVSSAGSPWKLSAALVNPQAWSFIPNTHDLVISDASQKAILLFKNIQEASSTPRILVPNALADKLAVTRTGEQVVAANTAAGDIWVVDLKSGAVVPKTGVAHIEMLAPLRDGFTFLLSESPTVTVMRLKPPTSDNSTVAQTDSPKE